MILIKKIKHEHIIITKQTCLICDQFFSLMQERLPATSQVRLVPKTASTSFTLACLYIESSLYEQVLQHTTCKRTGPALCTLIFSTTSNVTVPLLYKRLSDINFII